MTGTVRALGYPSGAQLASAGLGTQHAVPEGQGSGWQAYGVAEFNRANTNTSQQVKLEARLVLPVWAGKTNIAWHSLGRGCTRGANQREVNCELWSPPFQNVPYPCPNGKAGVQPGACTNEDELEALLSQIEEDNDNYADNAFPDGTPPPQPDPEAEADYAVCGEGDDQSSCLDSGPTATETQEAACAPICDAFFVGSQTQAEDIPEWVRDLQVFRDFEAAGLERNVMFYESEVAVGSAAATPESCLRRYVCLYQHASYRGRWMSTAINGSHYNLDDYGLKNQISSWANKKVAHDSLMGSFEAGNRCLPRRHRSFFVGSFNDKADELDVFSSNVRCNIG